MAKQRRAKQFNIGRKKVVNKWLLLIGVTLVAVLGIMIVRYSSAAKSSVWVHHTDKMQGGVGTEHRKGSGLPYRITQRSNSASTIVGTLLTPDEIHQAGIICFHSQSGIMNGHFTFTPSGGRGVVMPYYRSSTSSNVACSASLPGEINGKYAAAQIYPDSGSMKVDTIYGVEFGI